MTNYQIDTLDMIPGETPSEKYNHLREVRKFLIDLAYPKRGSESEQWTVSDIQEIAERLMLLEDE